MDRKAFLRLLAAGAAMLSLPRIVKAREDAVLPVGGWEKGWRPPREEVYQLKMETGKCFQDRRAFTLLGYRMRDELFVSAAGHPIYQPQEKSLRSDIRWSLLDAGSCPIWESWHWFGEGPGVKLPTEEAAEQEAFELWVGRLKGLRVI